MIGEILAQLAIDLNGTTEAPHFDRRAFKTQTIFVTLAPDGRTANLKLDRDQQDHWCPLLPHGLAPVNNKWGNQGWTVMQLDKLTVDDIAMLVRLAWSNTAKARLSRKT
ncbi:MAG: MmcQ/YjbR family DNA-binding protein [Proteobacteria bacterium]|nr:MAG: MmcQ/YjbR family DNA-binding protein [Pseudomonadota bacterium]